MKPEVDNSFGKKAERLALGVLGTILAISVLGFLFL
jgi:hypothetical protein